MKKKYIVVIFFIILIFFSINVYNFFKSVNNINSKSEENIIEKILNTKEYSAKIKVTIYSNKNQNEYEINQTEKINENYSFAKILNPKKEEDLEIELNNNKLTIKNTNLNLEKLYENYNSVMKNYLFLSNFLKEANIEKIKYKENEIIISNKKSNNYNVHKELYINKKSKLPSKMIIIDDEQNIKAIIEYIEIELK